MQSEQCQNLEYLIYEKNKTQRSLYALSVLIPQVCGKLNFPCPQHVCEDFLRNCFVRPMPRA